MKNKIYHLKNYLLLFLLTTTLSGFSQIVLNPASSTGTVALGAYGNATISVPSEALTGDNIALNITLPGTLPANCTKSVSVTKSSNLVFQSSGGIGFTQALGNPNLHENDIPLAGNDGQNFNLFYKFPGFTTCDGTVGTFDVTIKIDCGGAVETYTTSVSVTARAANYWEISKKFVTGNLTCGISQWRVIVKHNNPNGAGLGTYKLSGTITESPLVPVISGSTHTVNLSTTSNGMYYYPVSLQNCADEGSVITNTANFDFDLGNGDCGEMVGSVTDDSDSLATPNANISFVKSIQNYYTTNFSPGCEGRYRISVCNNGNVPWTNLVIRDTLNIPGINILGSPNMPSGWTSTNVGGAYTFTDTSGVLNPGDCAYFYINFQIDPSATVGDTIRNTAFIDYQGAGGNGANGTPTISCPGVTCPIIDTAVQNTSSSVYFVVDTAKAIPSIKKCILDPPNALVPPIYQIGDTIKYSVMVGNSGAGNLNTVVSDAMGMPAQNLQIIPGSINYKYYTDENSGYANSCSPSFGTPYPSLPFTVNANTSDLQDPTFTINGMPGTCELYKANFLIIEFEAVILPQLHGTKVNRAVIPNGAYTLSSAVNYSIDQVGVLAIHKRADKDIVENGQSFNYIIEVTNNGSVPLNQLVITDALPECVTFNGQVTIKNNAGTVISSTNTANVQINVDPLTELQPGDTFTINILVVKNGSGNCCNEKVSATGVMTTSGVTLSANYGSAEAPAACVKGTECCDIEDFSATLTLQNGQYYVNINGGSVPIQEVEISMMDYHIEYSQADCKPADLGTFGTLSTSLTNLSGLILNSGDNNSNSLTWLPGSPSMLTNTSIPLDILDPLALNIACCDVIYSFCLKVKVKDANCNVCEKTICFTSGQDQEPEPCNIEVKQINSNKEYCVGDDINVFWSGTVPSGNVNISLMDNTSGNIYQVLANNISNTGSFTYTIPDSIPCNPEREWSFIIEDSEGLCTARSNTFKISCCEIHADCDCGKWSSNFVSIKQKLIAVGGPHDEAMISQLKNIGNPTLGLGVVCGELIELKRKTMYSIAIPDYICNTEDCPVTYEWQVIDPQGVITNGTGKNFNFNFNNFGDYKVILTPICGGKKCPPCVFTVRIPKFIDYPSDPKLPNFDKQ